MSAWAIEHKGERLYFKSCGKYSQEVSDIEAVYTQIERGFDGTVRKHYYAKASGRVFTLR